MVTVTSKDVAEGLGKWQYTVVRSSLGSSVLLSVIKRFMENRWKHYSQIEAYFLKNSMFVVISNEGSKGRVLEQSLWPMGNKMLFLRP